MEYLVIPKQGTSTGKEIKDKDIEMEQVATPGSLENTFYHGNKAQRSIEQYLGVNIIIKGSKL
jgi:hypothetical protein